MIPESSRNPLAEVFGYPINNDEREIKRQRENKLCPFHNSVPNCTKVSVTNPLGVCSVYHKEQAVITCPVRFREGWKMIADAAEFFFGRGVRYTALPEVRLFDKNKRKAGNIDYVLVSHDERGRILDFASLEVQAVYISGTISGAFTTYMEDQYPNFDWTGVKNYPHPDYLSSSTKRLVPQMLVKGGIFKQWQKKQAVAVQKAFFETLPVLQPVPREQSDLAWLIYDLVLTADESKYELTHVETVYTNYQDSVEKFIFLEADDIKKFTEKLQTALDSKLEGRSTSEIPLLAEDTEAEDSEEDETI